MKLYLLMVILTDKLNFFPPAHFQSTVCERIIEAVGQQHNETEQRQIIALSQDSFYRELGEEELKRAKNGTFNFDHPGNMH